MSMHPNPIPQTPPGGAPGGQAPTAWVFRAGSQVVLVQGGNLPARCVRCNQPAHGKPLKKTLYWHDPMWYLLILAGILVYAIVAICIRKKVKLDVALCQEHKKTRAVWMTATLLTLLSSPVLFITGAVIENVPLILLGLVMLVAGLVCAVLASQGAIRPSFIDDRVARLKGAKEPFLASLPPWPYA